MAEHGKGKAGGGDADEGKGPVATFARPVIRYDPGLVRRALQSIDNLPYSKNAEAVRSSLPPNNNQADPNLVPVRNPNQFWTVCNGCMSLVKCEMICRNCSTICPHHYYTFFTSDKADLPDIYRAINRFVYEELSSKRQAANSNPFNNSSNPDAALNSEQGSLAGLGSSTNSTSSKCCPFSTTTGFNSKINNVIQAYMIEKQKASQSSSSFVQRFNSKFSGETLENSGSLPSPKERYDRAIADWEYFYDTLRCITKAEGRNLQIPIINGKRLYLHQVFVEVTSRGGIQKVMKENRLKEVCAILPQKIDEDYLFVTYMALLDFYEYLFFIIPNENRIFGNLSLDLSSRECPPAGGIGTGVSSTQVQHSVPTQRKPPFQSDSSTSMQPIASQQLASPAMPMPDQRSVEPSCYEAQAATKTQKPTTRVFCAEQSSSAMLAPNNRLPQQASAPPKAPVVASQQKSIAKYTASKQLNVIPHVPAPCSTEAPAATIQQEEANFFLAPGWSRYAIPDSACHLFAPQSNSAATMETTIKNIKPYAPEPNSSATQVSAQTSATQVSAQTSATHVSAQTVTRTMQMQTTDSWLTEDPAYSPLRNKRMITPAESTSISNLPSTPSADKITLGEQVSDRPFNTKLIDDQQENQMKADETRAGTKDNSDDFGSQNRK